jgi:pyruvate formate lyase activating enzyme
MRIGGIIDISTKDIPHKTAMVIFTVGCNFKCEFCHNKYLLYPNVGKVISAKDLVDKAKINLLVSGVSISGGEPTLQSDLKELCAGLTSIKKYVSVDTNGSNPEVIKEILPHINRVALDLKGPLDKKNYEKIAGVKVDVDKIIALIKILNNIKDLDFEIRTTYARNWLKPGDIYKILFKLKYFNFKGNFVLQQYQYSEGVGERFKEVFNKPEHESLVKILKPYHNRNLHFNLFLRDDYMGYTNIKNLL